MKRFIKWALLVVAVGMLVACGDDDEQTLVRQTVMYGTTVGTALLGPSDLVVLSPTTGAYIRTVGSVGYFVNGLTFDRTNGKLYATTSFNDPVFPDGLIEINQVTGVGTPIGAGAGMGVNVPTVNSLGQMFAWTEDSDDLVSIDKVTGLASVVGDSLLATEQQGLAFDNNDFLVLVNELGVTYSINTATGAATPIGDIGVTAHHGDFHPGTGLYWGIDLASGTLAPRNLIISDIAASLFLDTVPTLDFLHTVTFGFKWVLI